MRLLHSGAPSITEFPGGQNSEIKSERSEAKRAEFGEKRQTSERKVTGVRSNVRFL